MDLQYITRQDRDEDGRPYGVHFLCDMLSGRAFGYVEEPSKGSDQIMFIANPYEGATVRRYLSLESAKDFLEGIVAKADMDECLELAKSVTAEDIAEKLETEKKT